MDTLIIDLTKAYAGSEPDVVHQSKSAFAATESAVIVIRRENQPSFQQIALEEVLLPNPVHYATVASAVGAKLFAALERDHSSAVTIVTGHRVVFDLEAAVPTKDRARVKLRPFSALRPYEQKAAEFSWPADLMPLDQAVDILVDALRRGGATTRDNGVRKSLIRPFLERIDDRFRRPHPLAMLPGVVSFIVAEAARRDRVKVSDEPHNPAVWLHNIQPQASPVATLPIRKSRSQKFIDVLTEARLGPFASIRLNLYANLALVMNTESSVRPTIGEVISQAIEKTRRDVVSRGDSRAYPWRKVREFLITLLGRRPVLVDEGGARVAPSFKSLTTRVHSLSDKWDVDLEGELVLALVQANVEISLADTPLLAGALYYSREEEDEARAEQVIAHLLDTGRLTESAGAPYRLTLPNVAPTLVHGASSLATPS